MLALVRDLENPNADIWFPRFAATSTKVVTEISLLTILRCKGVRGHRRRKTWTRCRIGCLKSYTFLSLFRMMNRGRLKLSFQRLSEFIETGKLIATECGCVLIDGGVDHEPYWLP